MDYDLLSAFQDATPLYDAIGARHMMDGPYDWEMAFSTAHFAAAFAAGEPWNATYAAVSGIVTMVDAHLSPAYLFGLLVTTDWWGNTTKDLLGYDL